MIFIAKIIFANAWYLNTYSYGDFLKDGLKKSMDKNDIKFGKKNREKTTHPNSILILTNFFWETQSIKI